MSLLVSNEAATFGPIINTLQLQPENASNASQSLVSITQDPHAGIDTQEDLIVFTPPSSPVLPESLLASPIVIQGCIEEQIVRLPATSNSAIVPACMSGETGDREAMLFQDIPQRHHYPPPISGGLAPPTRQNRTSEIDRLPCLPAMLAKPIDAGIGSAPRLDDDPTAPPVFTSNGRNIVIANLPVDVTPLFVLQRIRGGNVTNCCLTKFKGKGTAQEEMIAVVTFETARAAEQYVELLRTEHASSGVWAWSTAAAAVDDEDEDDEDDDAQAVIMTAQVERYTQLPRIPHTDLSSLPLAYPPAPPRECAPPTRCLVVVPCASEELETIWRDLDLPRLLSLPYYRAQVEDIWLDGYERDELGVVAAGALHIRFTSTRLAVDTKSRVAGRRWAVVEPGRPWSAEDPLQFEADPCATGLTTMEKSVGGRLGYEYLEKGHLALLALSDMDKISQVFHDWRAQNAAAKNRDRPVPHPHVVPAAPDPDQSPCPPECARVLSPFEKHLVARLRHHGHEFAVRFGIRSSATANLVGHTRALLGSSPNTNHSELSRDCPEGSTSPQAQLVPVIDPRDYLVDAPWNIRVQTATFLSTHPPSSSDCPGPIPSVSPLETGTETERDHDADDEMETEEAKPQPAADASKYLDYNHEAWGPGSGATTHCWCVSMAEYTAMSEEQWRAFGTCFYRAPEGFDAPETATARRIYTRWDGNVSPGLELLHTD